MPIVWEWLEAPDHTRRTRGNANLHGAAGEGSREGSPVRVFNQSLRYTSHCFRHRPFFFFASTTHTGFVLPMSITLKFSVSVFIHPLKTNELHSCLWFPEVRSKLRFPESASTWRLMRCVYKCMCAFAIASECVFVVLCGRSKNSVGGRLGRDMQRTTIHQKAQTLASISTALTMCLAGFWWELLKMASGLQQCMFLAEIAL